MSSSSNGILNISYADQIWTSIEDMPIWNWNKICETGDLIYLFKKHNKRKAASKELEPVWMELQQQHMNEFGIDFALLVRIKTMRKVIKLNLKFYETRDRSLLNIIDIEKSRIEQSTANIKTRFYNVVNYVSKHMAFRVNPKEFSVVEWYHALKNMEKQHGEDNKG